MEAGEGSIGSTPASSTHSRQEWKGSQVHILDPVKLGFILSFHILIHTHTHTYTKLSIMGQALCQVSKIQKIFSPVQALELMVQR